jgi:hypothetical protein
MKVEIQSISSGNVTTLRGEPEQVRQQILALYPWVARKAHPAHQHDPSDIKDVLTRLAHAQDLMVQVDA